MSTLLTRAAAAYASGNDALGADLFDQALPEIEPLVRATVFRTLGGSREAEDAIQNATIRIWTWVTRGVEPAIELYARSCALDEWRRSKRHQHSNLSLGDDFDHRERSDYDPSQEDPTRAPRLAQTEPDHAAEVVDRLDTERQVTVLAERRQVWGPVAQLFAEGHGPHSAAEMLGRPRGTVRRWAVEMRVHLEEAS